MNDKSLLIGSDSAGIARPLRVDSSGRLEIVTQRSVVSARVYNNADITLADSTLTALTFNSEEVDTHAMHSLVSNTGRLTCQVAGSYLAGGCVHFAAHATGRRYLGLRLNGTTLLGVVQVAAVTASFPVVLTLTTQYTLALNDYLELLVYQDSGGSLNAVYAAAYSPVFWAVMV